MPDHLLTKLWVATRATYDEVLISESWPPNGRSILQPVAGWQRHEQAFLPQRNDIAVCGVSRIMYEGHVKFPVVHACHEICGGHAFDELDEHVGIFLRIRLEQLAQKSCSHGGLNADAQAACLTPTGL